eukprot:TRINITY_DN7448_c0_g3_i1.p1 TRINITY_DN7448_c0_g3~~TRINITY_DN7448_c0_g3_i1.p1  ORF type:complete len:370 (+),score=25.45 TRINITY_DN7448_c0_g3_i1:62-1111(+)
MGDYMRRDMGGRPSSRANVQQLKLIGQSHPTGLTPSLLRLFEPRPPVDYKPPVEKRKLPPLSGVAQFVSQFAEPGDPEYEPPVTKGETKVQKKERIRAAKLEVGAAKLEEALTLYDPAKDPKIDGDPYKTLFVSRISYETTEHRIRREFEAYGPIKKIRLVNEEGTGKPRGYAFVEFQHTRDMKAAYKQADGRKVDGRRIVVDVERGRTVPGWRPRRLGGGLGSTRIGADQVNQHHSGRDPAGGGASAMEEEAPRVRDRDRDRDRERERERPERADRDRDRTRERDRDRDRGGERGVERSGERFRDRERPRERERERGGRERERERERERDVDVKFDDHGRSRDRERDR